MKIIITAVFLAFFSGALLAWLMKDTFVSEVTVSLNESPLREIALTDHDEQSLLLKSLHGKTVVLNFMFNGCSPVQTVGLRRVFLDHELDRQDKNVVFLSISVVPEIDTPAQLKRFAQRYGIYAKNWRLGIIDRAALDQLLLAFNAGQPVIDDPIAHLNTVFLINPQGKLVKVYTGYPINPSLVYADLAALMESETTL